MSTRSAAGVLLVLISALVVGCGGVAGPTAVPTVCDGVSSEMGGCTADRHEYVGTTCDEVAAEFGAVLDGAARTVIDGPAVVGEQAKSSRLKVALSIAAVDADGRLESLGLASACDVDAFMAIAEPLLTATVRANVGAAMYDGEPVVSFEEWLADVRETLGVIRE